MIDTHAHINADAFDADRDDVFQHAIDNGIHTIIVPDIKPIDRDKLIAIVDSKPFLYRGIGIHPHHTAEGQFSDLEIVEQECKRSKVVAIGEIGLDYHYDFSPPATQKSYFREQIQIAKRNDLPIIVHNREADEDVLRIIEEEQDGSLRGVLHCFSSNVEILKRALALGLHVSFTGNITFKKSTLHDVVSAVDSDKYMIETDSPYITPVPFRGQRNEPQFVRFTAEKISEIRGETVDQIVSSTTTTARKLFGLLALLLLITVSAYAQPTKPDYDDFENDRDYDIAVEYYYADSIAYERWIKPRTFGIGLSVGSNTVVEQQKFTQQYDYTNITDTRLASDPKRWKTSPPDTLPERSFTYEGLTTIGATLMYGISSHWAVEGTYLYTKNSAPARDFGLDPIIINVFEFVGHYSLNPYKKINFLMQAGGTYATTSNNDGTTSKLGINAGLGLGMNIPTSIGLFYPVFNVRFNFMFGTDQNRPVTVYPDVATGASYYYNSANPAQRSENLADVTTIYSIPRLTIMFYPNF
ncbi:MAG: YchF/TatD family DNA exonuclease [Ignavibacteria bacterium]|nr:YchF/TatD family DNA exonuclease [Ignavibacteria bacterium]